MNQRLTPRRSVKWRRKSTFLRVMKGLLRNPLSAICLSIVFTLILVMRICDLFLCIPGILMALVAALGPGRKNLRIAIGISSIPGVTRQFRALMLNVISNDYITAARAAGAKDFYIIPGHCWIPFPRPPWLPVKRNLGSSGVRWSAQSILSLVAALRPAAPMQRKNGRSGNSVKASM